MREGEYESSVVDGKAAQHRRTKSGKKEVDGRATKPIERGNEVEGNGRRAKGASVKDAQQRARGDGRCREQGEEEVK